MSKKIAIMVYLGDYYGIYTSMSSLSFSYKNVSELSDKLIELGWTVYPPVPDELATKKNCIDYLNEKISLLENDDWLLFYYVGHGDRYISADANDYYPVHLVTSLTDTGLDPDNPNSYFTDSDYQVIVENFKTKVPNGHIITILDCCYAFGIINNYEYESEFHTVLPLRMATQKPRIQITAFSLNHLKNHGVKALSRK